MGPFGKGAGKSKGRPKGPGQSGKYCTGEDAQKEPEKVLCSGENAPQEPEKVLYSQTSSLKVEEKPEQGMLCAVELKSEFPVRKVENFGVKGEKKEKGQSRKESFPNETNLHKAVDPVLFVERSLEKSRLKSSEDSVPTSTSLNPVAKVQNSGMKVLEAESKSEKERHRIPDQDFWSQRQPYSGEGIPVAKVQNSGMKVLEAESKSGKERQRIPDQDFWSQRQSYSGEGKQEEIAGIASKSGSPAASQNLETKAGCFEAAETFAIDTSSLTLSLGLNRIKTRSGPLCEDGSEKTIGGNTIHSQHVQAGEAKSIAKRIDETSSTQLPAQAVSLSKQFTGSTFFSSVERGQCKSSKEAMPCDPLASLESLCEEVASRPRERSSNSRGNGRTNEGKNMKLQKSAIGPTSQSSQKGFSVRGTSEGTATSLSSHINSYSNTVPSAASQMDGTQPKSKELRRSFHKADHIMEKKVPSRLASYFDSDCNKISDTEGPSKQLDAIKETESIRFQSVPQMPEGPKKKKWPKDIKSFSHELGPRGGRFQGLPRPHSDNDLEELLGALRARFNTAKEEVDTELLVFAADLVEILDKNNDSFPEWQEKVEDLLVLARRCAMMSACDFRRECESIVQELDDKRQELPMGLLKQLHTRMLFILTRCTRLLQFQKETGAQEEAPLRKIQQCLKGVPSLERTWASTVPKKGKLALNSKKLLPEFLDRSGRGELSFSASKSSKIDEKPKFPSEKGESEILGQLSSNISQADSPVASCLASSKTSTLSVNETNEPTITTHDCVSGLKVNPEYDSIAKKLQETWDLCESGKKVNDDDPQETIGQPTTPSKQTQRMPWGYWADLENAEETESVICRICEEEVPTLHLEAHSLICTLADTCDVQGLSLDERLRILADNLEKLIESNTPKSSQPVAGDSPDVVKNFKLNLHDSFDGTSPKLSDFHGRGTEARFDDLYAIDTANAEEPKGFNLISFKPHLGAKSDQGVASSSAGSLTPRSTLNTPRTSQLDLLWAERSSLIELEDLRQIYELVDIARCVANKSPSDEGALEYVVACIHDLQDVLGRNKTAALTVDTFGRRIENLLREKYLLICERIDSRKLDLASSLLEDDGTSTDDGFYSLKSTPTHPAYKDRTTISDFEILKPISRGAFGRVFLARKRTTGDLFAIKVLRKIDMIRKNAVENILAERDILITVCNPFVVRFFYSFTCRENLYLVMEYLNGGDLYSLLRNFGCLEEHLARVYIAELVLALEYLHSLGVVHRDLKPDNILIAHDGHIKLTDFGLSKVGLINSTDDLSGPAANGTVLMDANIYEASAEDAQSKDTHKKRSAVGTPDYLAPEILLGTEHGYTADWWSTGIILFEFLTGMPPFNAEHPQIIFDNILNRKIPWPRIPEDMSYEAEDLIDKLLIEDPNQRLGSRGALEVKSHPFFKDINWDTLARQKAAFVPSPESVDDTSYFTSRHLEGHTHSIQDYGDSSDCSCSSFSSSSLKGRLEEEEDECGDLADFESSPSVKNTFNNFSFKNLPQLASINYDLLSQTGKDSLKGHSRQPSAS